MLSFSYLSLFCCHFHIFIIILLSFLSFSIFYNHFVHIFVIIFTSFHFFMLHFNWLISFICFNSSVKFSIILNSFWITSVVSFISVSLFSFAWSSVSVPLRVSLSLWLNQHFSLNLQVPLFKFLHAGTECLWYSFLCFRKLDWFENFLSQKLHSKSSPVISEWLNQQVSSL